MTRTDLAAAVVALVLTGCGAPADGQATPAEAAAALREGGHVLYVRHGETEEAGLDAIATLTECRLQRQLTDDGRTEMAAVGDALDDLGVEVSAITSSPFCRCTETTELLFGPRVAYRVDPDLVQAGSQSAVERERMASILAELLEDVPADGTSAAVVGHYNNLRDATGVEVGEGGSAVFRPGPDGPELVATVTADQWLALAAADG